jgi:phosphoribosylanthranilate isomerase
MTWTKGQSGNPAGSLPGFRTQYRREVAAARKHFADGLLDATEAAMDLARGAYIVLLRDERSRRWVKPPSLEAVEHALELAPHTVRVYQQPPDLGAIQLVWERVAGKVPQPHEHEVRQLILQITEDHSAVAEIIRRHIPAESLPALRDELAELDERRRRAVSLLAG